MVNIYNFVDLASYLNEVLKEKKLKNPSFSIRAWARQLGLKHHNSLYEILQRKRNVPQKHVLSFAKSLELSSNETEFFSYLCKLDSANSLDEKSFYLQKMEEISKRKEIEYVEIENINLINDPLHFFIAELATMPNFKADTSWIKKKFIHDYSEEEIQSAINRLILAKILVKNSLGQLEKTHKNIITKSDVSSDVIKKYHVNVLELAKEAIYQQHVEYREFRSLVFKMNPALIGQAKIRLRELINQFMTEFEAAPGVDVDLYELNVQLFGVSSSDQVRKKK